MIAPAPIGLSSIMAHVHALLVGIDRYIAVRPLAGCVADIAAVDAMLRSRVPADDLTVHTLTDEAATWAAVADSFRQHLGHVGAGDVALFYFAGHGSQEPSPDEWRAAEPDGLNETIVCVDSRTDGVWDLSDKEINGLVAEAAAGGAHVVTIFDSCHSGGVTRDVFEQDDIPTSVRMAPAQRDLRPLSSYLPEALQRYDPTRLAEEGVPDPPHIALSACQPHQTAKELPTGGVHRGAFSVALQEALGLLREGATYKDVDTAIKTMLRTRVKDQACDLFAGGGASISLPFLGGAVQPKLLLATRDDDGVWWLDAGGVDGVADPGHGGEVALALFDDRSDTHDAAASVADASVTAVEPARSRLELVGRPGIDIGARRQLFAVVTRVGSATVRLVVTGVDAPDVARGLSANPYVAVTTEPHEAPSEARELTLDLRDGMARLTGGAGADVDVPAAGDAWKSRLADALAHVVRWHSLLDRVAPGSRVGAAVTLDLIAVADGAQTVADDAPAIAAVSGRIVLAYHGADPPRVKVRLRNSSDRRLFVAAFDLTQSYASARLFAEWVEPSSIAWAAGGQVQKLEIPDWLADTSQSVDRLKVLVCTHAFDSDEWTLPGLLGPRGLAERGAERDLGDDVEDPVEDDGWGTTLLEVVTSRG